MIDTKALRSRVLDLAIQGKLTEQLAEDGTAEELYAEIQAEKQRLIKEGKLKKEKPLPEIKPEEVPFEIPKNWKWVRMGDVYNFNPSVEANDTADAAFIPMERISAGYSRNFSFEIQNWGAASKNHTKFSDGDVAFAKITPCFENRKSFVAEGLPNAIGGGTTELIILRQTKVYAYYTYLLIIQQRFIDAGVSTYKGTAGQQRVKNDALKQYLVPLPPLAEQKRIVARVEEIFRLLDAIDAAQQQYAADAESLKAKLITLGIQGRLTEQLASDGTAEELYAQIQEEKQRLIQEGKIKREKPLPEIKPEEVPFDIPGNWKWVRLGEVCRSIMDGDHQPPPQTAEGIPFLVISNVSKGVLDFSSTRHVSKEYFEALSSERIAETGDILFTVTGSFGIPVKVLTDEPFCFQRHIALLKLTDSVNMDFLFRVLGSELVFKQCDNAAIGVAQRTVGIRSLRNMIVPLPPLAEQKRIADRLEELLGALG